MVPNFYQLFALVLNLHFFEVFGTNLQYFWILFFIIIFLTDAGTGPSNGVKKALYLMPNYHFLVEISCCRFNALFSWAQSLQEKRGGAKKKKDNNIIAKKVVYLVSSLHSYTTFLIDFLLSSKLFSND